MHPDLLKVALRNNCLFIPGKQCGFRSEITKATLAFAAAMADYGFALEEETLHALNCLTEEELHDMIGEIQTILKIHLNWTPLVKGWLTPTGENALDHLVTFFANYFSTGGTGMCLPCGHFIPDGTFPMERYNGCPFCGKPFVFDRSTYSGQGSKIKTLGLMRDADMKTLLKKLLTTTTPLDATMAESVKILVGEYPLPDIDDIPVRETLVAVTAELDDMGRIAEMQRFFKTPDDIMRYLWYRKTGQLKIIPPKELINNAIEAAEYYVAPDEAARNRKRELRLHFDRRRCSLFARWFEELPLTAAQICENMNPRRQMWVRFIRALRFTEYSRRPDMPKLKETLDLFYRRAYPVWAGRVQKARDEGNSDEALRLLQQRPGLFARSLFAAMLTYGPHKAIEAFRAVIAKVPPRLVLTLGSYAESYFMPEDDERMVTLPSGRKVFLPLNHLLANYSEPKRLNMIVEVKKLYLDALFAFYKAQPHQAGSRVYIAPELFGLPVPVGDRSKTIQDTSYALPGQEFKVDGDKVRLFMQWGEGLPAQHLDMDLSCGLVMRGGEVQVCSYFNLSPEGACHSGDIRSIPDYVGTAEYIELDLPVLERRGCEYVVFTCNAYSCGNITIGLSLGWMDSKYPMTVSDSSGVAYDPSTVSHIARVDEGNLAKGLVFGILDVSLRKITWLEMPFTGLAIPSLNINWVMRELRRLREKVTIGEALAIRADAQSQIRVDSPEKADEIYSTPADAIGAI